MKLSAYVSKALSNNPIVALQ